MLALPMVVFPSLTLLASWYARLLAWLMSKRDEVLHGLGWKGDQWLSRWGCYHGYSSLRGALCRNGLNFLFMGIVYWQWLDKAFMFLLPWRRDSHLKADAGGRPEWVPVRLNLTLRRHYEGQSGFGCLVDAPTVVANNLYWLHASAELRTEMWLL